MVSVTIRKRYCNTGPVKTDRFPSSSQQLIAVKMGNSPSSNARSTTYAQPPAPRYITPDVIIGSAVQLPPGARPGSLPAVAVPIEGATTLKTEFHVKQDTIRVYENLDKPWQICLDFNCDSSVECLASLQQCSVDTPGSNLLARIIPKYPRPAASVLLSGQRATFLGPCTASHGKGAACDTRLYQLDELLHSPTGHVDARQTRSGDAEADSRLQYVGALLPPQTRLPVPPTLYPFVITLHARPGPDGGVEGPVLAIFLTLVLQRQAAIDRPSPPGWRLSPLYSAKVVRTCVSYLGGIYEIKSMYGAASPQAGQAGAQAGPGQQGSECVVCLTEASTHAALPCGHVCLCRACAGQFSTQSNKCPVCRAVVLELLDLETARSRSQGSSETS